MQTFQLKSMSNFTTISTQKSTMEVPQTETHSDILLVFILSAVAFYITAANILYTLQCWNKTPNLRKDNLLCIFASLCGSTMAIFSLSYETSRLTLGRGGCKSFVLAMYFNFIFNRCFTNLLFAHRYKMLTSNNSPVIRSDRALYSTSFIIFISLSHLVFIFVNLIVFDSVNCKVKKIRNFKLHVTLIII